MASYLDAVRSRVVVYDGATGTNLQLRELGPDDFGGASLEGCNEILVDTRPEVVADLHRSFFDVGVDVVETDSFGTLPWVLAEYGLAHRTHELALKSARIAREVASGYGDGKWVAGSLGPGTKLASLGWIRFAELRDGYELAAQGLLEGGVDLLIIETVQDLLQAKGAVIGCRRAMAAVGRQVPIQVQVTIELTGRMLPGTEIGAALTALDALHPDVVGLNCATGPSEMSEHLRYLSQHARMPISCLPNAGLPSVVEGRMHYDLTPSQLADHHARFITDYGVSVVGGCCGTTPEHLKAVVERCAGLTPAARAADFEPGIASIYSHVPYDQAPSFLVVGERTNANGSKKFREAMLADDWETCVAMAKEQVREGAHVLDVCVDYTGEDGVADMDAIASRFCTQATLPLMLDSTEPEVIETGLQWIGGKAILNSVNLEDGDAEGTRLDRFLRLAREYGAAVVATCIDEQGQARTAERKYEAAKAIHDLAVERYGLEPTDLLFDPLALTLGTGMEESRRDGIETIKGIRVIKERLPGVRTILGLSNVSFGLKPAVRHALNSVFLHECQQAGLDAAIVHAARIMPLNKIDPEAVQVCLDLIYDRRSDGYDPLQRLLAMFEGVSADAVEREDRSGWPVDRRLSQRIIDGDKDGLEAELDEALSSGLSALSIVNDVLLGGMKVVGDLFGSGQMQLPFVLQSAETMKAAVAYLEPHMERTDEGGKGRIVLATVKGDVHDIGKNLVDIIFTNNGYEVHNLGIKVPLSDMVEKAMEVKADAIGMSGLLVKSTLIMRENLEELNQRGLAADVPVLLGGAALTRTYVERDLRGVYAGRVFYGKDAFEGLHTMDKLMEMKRSGALASDTAFGIEAGGRNLPPRRSQRVLDDSVAVPARSPEVADDNAVYTPPFLGTQVVKGIGVDEIAGFLNETALFRNQWGFRPDKTKAETDDEFKARMRPLLREKLEEAKAAGLLLPAVVYGYFAANADGDDVVLWTDESRAEELARFSFPRQREAPFLCIADFFRTVASGEKDYAAFHIVTMGRRASEEAQRLFQADRYQDYLLLHGLGVELAEALAELWHKRVREEMGFADQDGPTLAGLFRQQYRGGRYSWGYPACPDLEDNAAVAALLGADRIGVECSEDTSFQYQPEQTTSAIICHHPQAKYFIAR
ncbi:MAG: 5-methyltetrahydrofolate--homocysteine methyltransferase [Acidimicrobiaceae bacterium]|jgi:5-methyltetrahydrofolate--homocysteine methyltransferase|nr:5-methyltetrahydrofolate--homocysteine methyltransferase [Acidimicrobiaceae bacterium]